VVLPSVAAPGEEDGKDLVAADANSIVSLSAFSLAGGADPGQSLHR
jgi:hypothetical protein